MPSVPPAPIPLLLDTDIGDDVDDVFALLLAALHPDVRLLGVTTVLGDTPHRARIARKLLDLAGRPDVPVAVGRGHTRGGRTRGPITLSGAGFVGPAGSDEWDALGARLHAQDGPQLLVEAIRTAPEPPVVAAIGPLTNVAEVFTRAPECGGLVRAVVIAGGRITGDTARGDYNFNWDPEAVRIVLDSGAPLIIGTVEIVEQAKLTAEHVPRLRGGSPACRAAAAQLALHFHQRQRDWTSMYDPAALTLAYSNRYVQTRSTSLRVRTTADRAILSAASSSTVPLAAVSISLDAPATIEHLLLTIGA